MPSATTISIAKENPGAVAVTGAKRIETFSDFSCNRSTSQSKPNRPKREVRPIIRTERELLRAWASTYGGRS
jgi:hypothetical protein